ncbi:hypothetical protein LEP1GSC074_1241 [Leptospira noguchii str. Hook]|nr:hypothetical protein LEP1GSC041_3960 [Leptospira noguchii str. 2006001870]EMS89158.1 hypothetical protein LEP1GSC074_1241 [Leptospira noguchii str. Hook]
MGTTTFCSEWSISFQILIINYLKNILEFGILSKDKVFLEMAFQILLFRNSF